MIVFKNTENRNHIKSSLIIEFSYNLTQLIEKKEKTQLKKAKLSKREIEQVKMLRSKSLGKKVEKDFLPCVNTRCRWVQFLLLYYKEALGSLWLLPAHTGGHCKICFLINNKKCRMSDIQVSRSLCACVFGNKI